MTLDGMLQERPDFGFGRIVAKLRVLSGGPSRTPAMRIFLALLTVVFVCLAGAADAQVSSPAKRVIDRARAASGGAGWNTLRGLHEVGQDGGVRYERWIDPLRYGLRMERHEPAGKHVRGFNSAAEWEIRADGTVTGAADRVTLGRVRSEAFFGAYGFFFPGRFDGRGALIGQRQALGRTFDVVRLQPYGGDPWDLWFDRATGLLGRMVNATGARPVTIEFSDYRQAGPVKIAFRTTTYGGDLTRPQERVLERIDFQPPDRNLFSLPRPAAG
jgi:hypothetical protein